MMEKRGKQTMSRTLLLPILFIILIGYIVCPYLKTYKILNDINRADVLELTQDADWPAVRAGLKSNSSDAMRIASHELSTLMENITKNLGITSNNAVNTQIDTMTHVFAALTSSVSDATIDTLVTPEGIANLVKINHQIHPGQPPILHLVHSNFISPTRFEVEVATNDGHIYQWTMALMDMHWKIIKVTPIQN
jgi:Protein of unknown function (DUF2939)